MGLTSDLNHVKYTKLETQLKTKGIFIMSTTSNIIKLSKRTLQIIANFTNINSGLLLEAGDKSIRVMKETKSVIGIASIGEVIPENVAIYNVSEFLNCAGLFKNPSFEFTPRQVNIIDDDSKAKMRYRYSEPKLITQAPKKNIQMPEGVAVVNIQSDKLDQLIKGANRLGLEDIIIKAEGNLIFLEATNLANEGDGNNFKIQISDAHDGADFEAHFNRANLVLIGGDYRVTIHSKITEWVMAQTAEEVEAELKLTYYIATEKSSKF